MEKEEIAKRVKAARAKTDLTQADVAKILNISYQAISNYERGKNRIDSDTLNKLCRLYGVSLQDILGDTEITQRKSPAAVQEDKGKAELDGIYYSLNEAGQEQIIDHARYVASKVEFKKCDKLSMAKEEA